MSRVPQPARDAPATEWNVYADALQEAGDPRGELIALNAAVDKGMSPADRDAYVDRHRDALFGPSAASFRVTRWHHCLPEAVELRVQAGDDGAAVMSAFLASPLAEARSLAVIGVASPGTKVDLSAAVAALAESLPPTLRTLHFVDDRALATKLLASRDFDPDANLVNFGDVSAFWRAAQLEELTFDVADTHQLQLGDIAAPTLQRFALHGLRLGSSGNEADILGRLGRAKFRDLRSFELRLVEEWGANIIADEHAYVPQYHGDENYEDRMDEAEEGEQWDNVNWAPLRPLLETLAKCPLERLALTSFENWNSLADQLAAVGVAPGLQILDLSDSNLGPTDWFLANKAKLGHIKRLILERTSLTDEAAARLRDLGPDIVHSHAAGTPSYRYVVGQE